MSIKKSYIIDRILLLLIIAVFINAFNSHAILCLVLSIFVTVTYLRVAVSVNTKILFILYIVIFIESIVYQRLNFWYFINIILPPIAMSFCSSIIANNKARVRNAEEMLIKYSFVIAFAMAIYGVCNNLLGRGALEDYSSFSSLYQVQQQRYSFNFWNGEIVYPTVEGMYFIPFLAIAWFCITKITGWKKWVCIIVEILCLFVLFKISTRSGLFVFILCLIYGILHTKKEKLTKKQFIMIYGVSLVIISIIYFEFDRILDTIFNSNLFIRLSSIQASGGDTSITGRFDIYLYIIKNMPKYIWGNMPSYQNTGASAHNMFLDIYMNYGIVPFLLIISYVYRQLCLHIKLKKLGINNNTLLFISLIMIGFLIIFFIEAPTSSNLILMNAFFFYCGMIEGLYRHKITEYKKIMNLIHEEKM